MLDVDREYSGIFERMRQTISDRLKYTLSEWPKAHVNDRELSGFALVAAVALGVERMTFITASIEVSGRFVVIGVAVLAALYWNNPKE